MDFSTLVFQDLNRKISPRTMHHGQDGQDIYILWTSTNNSDITTWWQPNHFVPVSNRFTLCTIFLCDRILFNQIRNVHSDAKTHQSKAETYYYTQTDFLGAKNMTLNVLLSYPGDPHFCKKCAFALQCVSVTGNCIICGEDFLNCRDGEEMVQCQVCFLWAHEQCTPMEGAQYVCDYCL